MQEFNVELRRQADKCNFGDILNQKLRDRLVYGIRSGAARRLVSARREVTLKKAEAIALVAEAGAVNVAVMKWSLREELKKNAVGREIYPARVVTSAEAEVLRTLPTMWRKLS